jgi:hypothetical protein
LSADAQQPIPPVSGLTPLTAGPLPLSRAAANWAALGVLFGTLFFGFGLPIIASSVANVVVPPGAITFGRASIIPAAGWSQSDRTETSVTLENAGVWISFEWLLSPEQTATQRVQSLADQMQAEYPQLSGTSDPAGFGTPTGAPGQLIALAGSTQTGLVASVVADGQAVDARSLGEATQFGESLGDIQRMLDSIRIRAADDG